MHKPGKVEFYLAFQGLLAAAFLGVLVFAIGDWVGAWA